MYESRGYYPLWRTAASDTSRHTACYTRTLSNEPYTGLSVCFSSVYIYILYNKKNSAVRFTFPLCTLGLCCFDVIPMVLFRIERESSVCTRPSRREVVSCAFCFRLCAFHNFTFRSLSSRGVSQLRLLCFSKRKQKKSEKKNQTVSSLKIYCFSEFTVASRWFIFLWCECGARHVLSAIRLAFGL